MKKTKKAKKAKKTKQTKQIAIIIAISFLVALFAFNLAFLVNYVLETEFVKNFVGWSNYYLNLALYKLDLVVHPVLKNTKLQNPFTPDVMAQINPWMWLRGYFISSALVGFYLIKVKGRKIELTNIIVASLLEGFFLYLFYAAPQSKMFSLPFFIALFQITYPKILSETFISFAGFLFGVGWGNYLSGVKPRSRYVEHSLIFKNYEIPNKK